jgi:flagellar basal-body rod modification protein FlgD
MSAIGSTSADIRSDYLKLLVTQLKNQDPLEPIGNNEMVAQLAQFSQLEQLENMSSTFQKVLLAEQFNQATDLIGKEISFRSADAAENVSGRVDSVELLEDAIVVNVGERSVELSEILTIRN